MGCNFPLSGYYSKERTANGKRAITFNASEAYTDLPIKIPCGQCIGCKLEHSRQWAMRIMHEAQLYEENCFITLTYDDNNMPFDEGLNKKDFQDFMKRLRKQECGYRKKNPLTGRLKWYQTKEIRYYHCGEYGETTYRPHYHACIFNHQFKDLEQLKKNVYYSETLAKLWGKGHAATGNLTFTTAAYVARYVTKKLTGPDQVQYRSHDLETGATYLLQPPYATMSRGARKGKGGIGVDWYRKFKNDCYPSDYIVVNGRKMQPPKAYEHYLEQEDPQALKKLKFERVKKAKSEKGLLRNARKHDKEKIQKAKLNLKTREPTL